MNDPQQEYYDTLMLGAIDGPAWCALGDMIDRDRRVMGTDV